MKHMIVLYLDCTCRVHMVVHSTSIFYAYCISLLLTWVFKQYLFCSQKSQPTRTTTLMYTVCTLYRHVKRCPHIITSSICTMLLRLEIRSISTKFSCVSYTRQIPFVPVSLCPELGELCKYFYPHAKGGSKMSLVFLTRVWLRCASCE